MAIPPREPGRSTRVAAYALCVEAGRVLLARWEGAAGTGWSLPGGASTFGEDPVATVRREVLAATGVVIEPGEVLGVDSLRMTRPGQGGAGPGLPDLHALRIVYSGKVVGRLLGPLAGGAGECDWVPIEAVSTLRRAELVDTALGWATLDTLV